MCKDFVCSFWKTASKWGSKFGNFSDPCDFAYTDKNDTKQCACPDDDTVLTDDVVAGGNQTVPT